MFSDGDRNIRANPRKFPQHSVIDELSDSGNQVVPDTSCVSGGHSYSDHQGPQNHLSTFGANTMTPTSRRLYGRYPGQRHFCCQELFAKVEKKTLLRQKYCSSDDLMPSQRQVNWFDGPRVTVISEFANYILSQINQIIN